MSNLRNFMKKMECKYVVIVDVFKSLTCESQMTYKTQLEPENAQVRRNVNPPSSSELCYIHLAKICHS